AEPGEEERRECDLENERGVGRLQGEGGERRQHDRRKARQIHAPARRGSRKRWPSPLERRYGACGKRRLAMTQHETMDSLGAGEAKAGRKSWIFFDCR